MDDCEEIKGIFGPHGIGIRNDKRYLFEFLYREPISYWIRNSRTHDRKKKRFGITRVSGTLIFYDVTRVKRSHARYAADVRVLPAVDFCSDDKLCRLKPVQSPNILWTARPKMLREFCRLERLPVDYQTSPAIDKSIDESLGDADDIEMAQRRMRLFVQESFPKSEKTSSRMAKSKYRKAGRILTNHTEHHCKISAAKNGRKKKTYRKYYKSFQG